MKELWCWEAAAGSGFVCRREGREVFSLTYEVGQARMAMWFDFREDPLVLEAEVREGSRLRFVYRPWRIELWVEETLADEEWPCGEPLFSAEDLTPYGRVEELAETPEVLPKVLGSFVGAEGWRPGSGVWAGDCMPYVRQGRYHVLYLKDRRRHRSKWGLGAHQWEHISTADLVHWDIHPMAVAIDDPLEGSICTGSWTEAGGREYLYYTVRMADRTPAPIRRSVSADGYRFEKDRDFGFTLSERYDGRSARDPKIIRAEDGWHMLVTTSDRISGRGALAHLYSADGQNWVERDSIYLSPDGDQPECPDYFFFEGKYYLVFSHRGTAQYRYSEEPFSGWRTPARPEIPCGRVPKAAIFGGRLIFTGFASDGGYAGTMTFREALAGADGELRFQ